VEGGKKCCGRAKALSFAMSVPGMTVLTRPTPLIKESSETCISSVAQQDARPLLVLQHSFQSVDCGRIRGVETIHPSTTMMMDPSAVPKMATEVIAEKMELV
jgi:hypothetical protein